MRLSAPFDAQDQSIGASRRYVLDALDGVAVDRDTAAVLVGELAANAVKHADSSFRVGVDVTTQRVRVEVINDEPEVVAAVTDRPSERGGYGLRMVDALAERWGTESTPTNKIVWFELALG